MERKLFPVTAVLFSQLRFFFIKPLEFLEYFYYRILVFCSYCNKDGGFLQILSSFSKLTYEAIQQNEKTFSL